MSVPGSFREDGAAALEWAAGYLERVRSFPVLAQVEPGDVRRALPGAPPDDPEPWSAVLEDVERVLVPALTHWQSPRYFAYFPATAIEPAILAELLAATLNQVGILWRTSPALQELEEVALDWLRQLVGLPEGFIGHLEDSASSSTLSALAAARGAAPGRRVVVCSEHTHSSIDKAARLLELDVRRCPVDSEHAMRVDRLDLDGACALVATVGSTSSAAVDPVAELGARCRDANVWLHVDAAYAGPAAVCPELRHHFAGWELADSVVLNPHKWMGVPMDCSATWTRRVEDYRRAFSLVPEYLRSPDDAANLSEVAFPLGRRFRALKLWAVLRCVGRTGLQQRIREHVRLAGLFERWVRDDPRFEISAPPRFSLVCFRLRGEDGANERLLDRVNRSGEIFISHTKLDQRFVLRLVVGNQRTTEEDLALAWDVIRRAATTT